jgi:catechol 2,3-dioxygenase-like lactoylglutathione lyase family enzyme|tara:strand:+ start:441 stop:899 length:459 start_codon:yes stop_codon:yes gene_type:complete
MKIEGLDHVALGVADMDKAVEWFTRVLGTEFYDIAGSAEVSVEDLGARYMLSLDHGVELISPVLPIKESAAPHIKRLGKLLEDRDTVVMRISFKVEGLSEAALAERGVHIEGKIETDEVKPLPLRNIKEYLAKEEDTLGIQMMFVEFDLPQE